MKDAAFIRLCSLCLVLGLPALAWLDMGARDFCELAQAARRARFS